MMSPSKEVSMRVTTPLFACAVLAISACGTGEGATATQPPSTPATTAAPTFCQAASQWAQSPAAAEAQAAAQTGDVNAIISAYRAWSAPTQAMVDALPDDAPSEIKRAFADLNDSVRAIAEEGGQTQKQADAYGKAQGVVLDYYDKSCL
jgi:hypothetical protein